MSDTNLSRRSLLSGGALLTLASALNPRLLAGETWSCDAGKVRDRFWLWGQYQGSHNQGWNLPGSSQITPVEAAYSMGTPNVVMVEYHGRPKLPCDQYVIPFRSLHRVVWSTVAAGGHTNAANREIVLKMAQENQNFVGVIMDDFFHGAKGIQPTLSTQELAQLQRRLKSGPKKLDLWVTVYTHNLHRAIQDSIHYCDVMTLWTWKAPDLANLSLNFEKAERLFPTTRKMLGCYMWDYGNKRPMPVSAMQQQCEQGLEWLHQGRIEGMIFLASCICDLNLESVEWTRNWIQKVGKQRLS